MTQDHHSKFSSVVIMFVCFNYLEYIQLSNVQLFPRNFIILLRISNFFKRNVDSQIKCICMNFLVNLEKIELLYRKRNMIPCTYVVHTHSLYIHIPSKYELEILSKSVLLMCSEALQDVVLVRHTIWMETTSMCILLTVLDLLQVLKKLI